MIARSEFQRLARQFGRGQCTLDGNDALRAGSMVQFEGIARGYNGKYYIISSRHTVSSHTGYITEVQFCSDTMGE
jgi:phage protein D